MKKLTKTEMRANWILSNREAILQASRKYDCPENCRAKCGNGATCAKSSGGGRGFWVWAFKKAGIPCSPMAYWSGSAPTPSTSINKGIAEYINDNAPEELR